MKNWVCDGLVFFEAPRMVYSAINRGRRILRCGCSGGSVAREWWISPVKQSTRLKFAWLTSVSGTCHVELDKLPY